MGGAEWRAWVARVAGQPSNLGEALPDRGGGLVRGGVPDLLVEDLDLHEPRVPRGQQPRHHRREVDHAIAEMAPAQQRVRGKRHHPVAQLDADDTAASPVDLRLQLRVPPDVVGVHDHADRLGRELKGQVKCVAQPGHDSAVGAEHRMHGLDAQPHSQPLRGRDQVGDRIGDHAPGQGEIPAAGWQPARDEDQGVRPQLGGLGDGPAVVRQGTGPGRAVRVGEEAAPAEAGHVQARGPDRGRRPAQAGLGHPVAPQPDGGNLVPDAQVHALRQVQVLHRGLIERQPVAAQRAGGHGRPAGAR